MRRLSASLGVLATVTALLLPASTGAQTWAVSVWDQLQTQYDAADDEGYQSLNFMIGRLNEGEKFTWSLDLDKGSYQIRAACDGDCQDVDLRFFEGSTEVTSDTAADYAPIMHVDVNGSGTFGIEVEMYECSVEPCYYGVGVFYK